LFYFFFFFFFFSSRRRHTRLQGDWSSDVCSSDLAVDRQAFLDLGLAVIDGHGIDHVLRGSSSAPRTSGAPFCPPRTAPAPDVPRSEERRVGKECRARWAPDQ